MRRPVGVKAILFLLCETSFPLAEEPLSPCFHSHSRERVIRSVQVGRSRFSRCCHLIGALWFCCLKSEPWARRLTQSPQLGFGLCLSSSWNGFDFGFVYAAAAAFTRLLLCNGS